MAARGRGWGAWLGAQHAAAAGGAPYCCRGRAARTRLRSAPRRCRKMFDGCLLPLVFPCLLLLGGTDAATGSAALPRRWRRCRCGPQGTAPCGSVVPVPLFARPLPRGSVRDGTGRCWLGSAAARAAFPPSPCSFLLGLVKRDARGYALFIYLFYFIFYNEWLQPVLRSSPPRAALPVSSVCARRAQ